MTEISPESFGIILDTINKSIGRLDVSNRDLNKSNIKMVEEVGFLRGDIKGLEEKVKNFDVANYKNEKVNEVISKNINKLFNQYNTCAARTGLNDQERRLGNIESELKLKKNKSSEIPVDNILQNTQGRTSDLDIDENNNNLAIAAFFSKNVKLFFIMIGLLLMGSGFTVAVLMGINFWE